MSASGPTRSVSHWTPGAPFGGIWLRYSGYAGVFGFAIYLWSKESYEETVIPRGSFEATPQEALDCACGLYLSDPSAWLTN